MGYLPSGCILACSLHGPLGVGGDLSVFPVSTAVGDIGVPLPPTVVGRCKHHCIVSGLFSAHTYVRMSIHSCHSMSNITLCTTFM